MTARLLKTFRFPPELVTRLDRYARRNHRSRTAVVEMALEKLLSAAEAANGAAPVDEVDVARWLSEATGSPRALCVGWVRAGRVTLGGRSVPEGGAVPRDALHLVFLDGEPVGW